MLSRGFGCSTLNFSKSVNPFRVPVFFVTRMGSGGPTDQELRANKFVGKPESCATGWVKISIFKCAQKLSLVKGFGV